MVYGDIFVVVRIWENQELRGMKDFALWGQERIIYLWNIVLAIAKMAAMQPRTIIEAYLLQL